MGESLRADAEQLHKSLFMDHNGVSYLDNPTCGDGFFCDLWAKDAEAIARLVKAHLATPTNEK